jgi:hypothetical protein
MLLSSIALKLSLFYSRRFSLLLFSFSKNPAITDPSVLPRLRNLIILRPRHRLYGTQRDPHRPRYRPQGYHPAPHARQNRLHDLFHL